MSSETERYPKRLGKKELGRHAFETRMPDKIWRLLLSEKDAANRTSGVIPNLALLLEDDRNLERAYLCTAHAEQIFKLDGEGRFFCGYRNIQMLLSPAKYLAQPAAAALPQHTDVPRLQDLIEEAWNAGLNQEAKMLTGGIIATRKYIGPSEAEAILLHHGVACTGHALHGRDAGERLLDIVQAYYSAGTAYDTSSTSRVLVTRRAPIFLQRPRHSVTIVGIECSTSGDRHLLVFDPQWRTPSAMSQPLALAKYRGWRKQVLLGRYRKPRRYVKKYNDFELLTID